MLPPSKGTDAFNALKGEDTFQCFADQNYHKVSADSPKSIPKPQRGYIQKGGAGNKGITCHPPPLTSNMVAKFRVSLIYRKRGRHKKFPRPSPTPTTQSKSWMSKLFLHISHPKSTTIDFKTFVLRYIMYKQFCPKYFG